MKLYAGTTEQFRSDARMHRIAEKLRAEYTTQIGHKPAPSEIVSWQNSLMALSMLLDQAELNDHGVILEYQLGNTSRRSLVVRNRMPVDVRSNKRWWWAIRAEICPAGTLAPSRRRYNPRKLISRASSRGDLGAL